MICEPIAIVAKVCYLKKIVYLVLPEGCVSYYGPHQNSCLKKIWLDSGCLNNDYPENLTFIDKTIIQAMNIR